MSTEPVEPSTSDEPGTSTDITPQSEPAAPAAAVAAPVITGNWYDGRGMSEEQIGYIQNKGWDGDPTKILTSYQELEKFNGTSADKLLKIPEPGDNDGWTALHSRLGRPDDAAGYGTELPDDGSVDAGFSEAFDSKSFDLGLSKDQNSALREWQMGYAKEAGEAAAKELQIKQETDMAQLKKDWGSGYAEGEEVAKRSFRRYGVTDEQSDELEAILGSAGLMRLFKGIGDDLMGDTGVHPDSVASTGFGITREQVVANKAELMNEMYGDPTRLANYNAGKGPDIEKMKRMDDYLATGAEPIRQ